jgi:hypothetical protein
MDASTEGKGMVFKNLRTVFKKNQESYHKISYDNLILTVIYLNYMQKNCNPFHHSNTMLLKHHSALGKINPLLLLVEGMPQQHHLVDTGESVPDQDH